MSTDKIGQTENIFGEALRRFRKSEGLTQDKFAEPLSITGSYVSDIEKGKAVPSEAVIRELIDVYRLSRQFLETGKGAMHKLPPANIHLQPRAMPREKGEGNGVIMDGSAVRYANATDLEHEYVLVPRYNVKVSLGGGSMVESEQIVDHLAFKSDWIRSKMHLNTADLVLITAMGDSMYPTIRDGDLLLLDKSKTLVADDAIYVLRFDGNLIAKRLQKLFDGSIQIKSDNKVYDAQLVPVTKVPELAIIGRVMWIGGRV
jgi:transcriptional regulator with XRE-family HTH domain